MQKASRDRLPSCPRVALPGASEYQGSCDLGDGIARLLDETELSFSTLDPEQRLGRCQNTTEPQTCRAPGQAGRVVDLHRQPRKRGLPHGRLESPARDFRQEAVQGFGRLHLLGFSHGGIVTYSVAGEETQRAHGLRNVKGMIILDVAMKFKEDSIRAYFCNWCETWHLTKGTGKRK